METTFLFVTNNRCPLQDFEKNPLTWAINSLEANSQKVEKYLIVVDGSSDFTLQNIQYLKDKFLLDCKVIVNEKRMGCSYSRKVGIDNLETELFFMGDDDCIYNSEFIETSMAAFQNLQKVDTNFSVLQLPVFENDIDFAETAPEFEIGKTYFEVAWFFHNFDKRVKDDSRSPIQIDTFKGVTLNLKTPIQKSGNFQDLSSWKTDYSEHIDLSYKMSKHNFSFYYLPDVKASCTHLRFGGSQIIKSELENVKFPGIDISYKEINQISINSSKTGCRVDDLTFIHDRIGLFLAFFLSVSLESAMYFAMTEYENLIVKSHKGTFLPQINLSLVDRKKLWEDSITHGINFAKLQNDFDSANFLELLYKNLNYKNEPTNQASII